MSRRAFWVQWWTLIVLIVSSYFTGRIEEATFFLVLLVWTWMLRRDEQTLGGAS